MSPPRDKIACQTSPCKCKICISSVESDVYNKKKIQMFVVNMTFTSSSEVKKCIFHECRISSSEVKKCMYAEGTHEIYIFSLHSMK